MQALVRATASRGLRQFRHGVRQFASDISHEDHAKEMNKWRIITIAAVPVCLATAVWDLSQGEHEHHKKPEYPYLEIRSKTFPWGDCALFDTHCGHEEEEEEEADDGGDE